LQGLGSVMMEKRKRLQGLYVPQQLIAYHQGLMQKMQADFGFPGITRLTQCSFRKDIQVFTMEVLKKDWNILETQFLQNTSMQQYLHFVMEITWNHLKPQLEEFYESEIKLWYLLGPASATDLVYTYSVKLFMDPLFKTGDTSQGAIEDKCTSMISGYIRELSGRGPERVTVVILDDQYMVVCIYGLISRYMADYALRVKDNYFHVQEILSCLVKEVLDYVFCAEYQLVPQKFIQVDVKKNLIVSLAVFNSIEKGIEDKLGL
jgi:uncharacterized protein YbcI